MPARAPRSRFGQDKKGGGREGGAAVVQETARAWPEGLGRAGAGMNGPGSAASPVGRAAQRIPPPIHHACPPERPGTVIVRESRLSV